MRRLALSLFVLALFAPALQAQKKPKENAQVMLGYQVAGINAVTTDRVYAILRDPATGQPVYGADAAPYGAGAGAVTHIMGDGILVRPGKNYVFTLAGGAWDYGVASFKVPAGYTLYLDDKVVTSFSTTNVHGGEGGRDVNLKILPNDGSEWLAPGYASTPHVGDFVWSLGLGRLSNGYSAGALRLRATDITSSFFTPDALEYTPASSEVQIVADTQSAYPSPRKIIVAPQATIYFDYRGNPGYTIYVYPGGVTPWYGDDNAWHFSSDPNNKLGSLVGWTAQYSITNLGNNQFSLDQQKDGISKHWVITKNGTNWTIENNSALRKFLLTSTTNGSGQRVETVTVQDNPSSGTPTVASKTIRTYQNFLWGQEEMVSEVSDPDGLALTTTYNYNTTYGTGGYGKLASIVYPTGGWIRYDYYDDTPRWGQLAAVYQPWQDGPATPSAATQSNSVVTYYDYVGRYGNDLKETLSGTETYVLGVKTGKTTVLTTFGLNYNGIPMRSDLVKTYDTAGTFVSSTTYAYDATADLDYAGKVLLQLNADGTQAASHYVRGDLLDYLGGPAWQSTAFNANTNGFFWCATTLYGAQTQITGSEAVSSVDSQYITTTYMVPNRSVMKKMIRRNDGGQSYELTYIYTGGGAFQLVGWTVRGYIDGLPINEHDSSGALANRSYIAGHVNYETTADGTQVQTFFDDLQRVDHTEKKPVAASGSYPAQPSVYTYYTYDAAGHVLTTTVTAGGQSLTSSQTYNLAGLVTSSTDTTGLTTTYSYANGGRTVTTTMPGSRTQISDTHLDGSAISVTGTAVVAQYYSTTVNADGTITHQTNVGSAASPRWSKSTTDWLGRAIKTEAPGYNGSTVVAQSFYNSVGQLIKTTTTGQADTLYVYDGLGQLLRSGLDIDHNGSLDLASNDRISEVKSQLVNQGGAWWSQTLNYTYNTAGSATPLLTGESLTRLVPYPYDQVTYNAGKAYAESRSYDIFRNLTVQSTVSDRDNRVVTATTDVPDSTINAVSVVYNGLAQTSQTPQGLTYITHYDNLGRTVETIDPRMGSSYVGYNDNTAPVGSRGQVAWTKDTAGKQTSFTYDSLGRHASTTDPLGKVNYVAYNTRNQPIRQWGQTVNPVQYGYNAYGEQDTMQTFRDTTVNWTTATWPASTGTADTTTWTREAATGLLLSKTDAQSHAVGYTYTARGQLLTRTWARNVVTTYGYDANTGEQTSITYSDGTPNLTYSYDRRGLTATITDATGSRTQEHCDCGKLSRETLDSGFYGGRVLGYTQDTSGPVLGRTTGYYLTEASGAGTEQSVTYGYDGYGRLNNVGGYQYSFTPNSNLIASVADTGSAWTQTRTWDPSRPLLSAIETKQSTTSEAKFAYTYDDIGRRTSLTESGAVFARYGGSGLQTTWGYNDRSEVTSSTTKDLNNNVLGGRSFSYNYDPIGNRVSSSVDGIGTNYTANSLNQYTARDIPNQAWDSGFAPAAASVSVNGTTATNRAGDYFSYTHSVSNTSNAVWQSDTITSSYGGSSTRTTFVPQNREAFTYDNDGNILTDGRWQYSWDAENRLTSMETLSIAYTVGAPRQRFEFKYDYLGRRVLKRSLAWNLSTSGFQLSAERKFLYDGWNLIAEYNSLNVSSLALIAQYTWGVDLSNRLQDAGGVGGLLKVSLASSGATLSPAFDGNGNIYAMVDRSLGTVRAAFEYSPYGELVRATGDLIDQMRFRFSTKYTDSETQLVYYGFRYYNPNLGRWLGRDSLEEKGGLHLYGFVRNNPLNAYDRLGQCIDGQVTGINEWNNEACVNGEWLLNGTGQSEGPTANDDWSPNFTQDNDPDELLAETNQGMADNDARQAANDAAKNSSTGNVVDSSITGGPTQVVGTHSDGTPIYADNGAEAAKYAAAGESVSYGSAGQATVVDYQQTGSGNWVSWDTPNNYYETVYAPAPEPARPGLAPLTNDQIVAGITNSVAADNAAQRNFQLADEINSAFGQSKSALFTGSRVVPKDYFTFTSGELKDPSGKAVETVVVGGVQSDGRSAGRLYAAGINAVGKEWDVHLNGGGKVGVSWFGGGELSQGGKTAPISLLNIDLGPFGFGGFATEGEFGFFGYRNLNDHVSVGGGLGF